MGDTPPTLSGFHILTMTYNPARHHRRSIRLRGYDYTRPGAYFVTLCVQHRDHLFGEVVNGKMRLNESGRIAAECWEWLGTQYPYVELDEWVVMPNHLHGIIVVHADNHVPCRDASRRVPTDGTTGPRTTPVKIKPLGQLIGVFKTISTPRINELRDMPGISVWQHNYHEHIIRNAMDLNRIREYILNNPRKWDLDREN